MPWRDAFEKNTEKLPEKSTRKVCLLTYLKADAQPVIDLHRPHKGGHPERCLDNYIILLVLFFQHLLVAFECLKPPVKQFPLSVPLQITNSSSLVSIKLSFPHSSFQVLQKPSDSSEKNFFFFSQGRKWWGDVW